MKIISWNVNGIRAIHRKGFLQWLTKENPDILGLQETKAHDHQLDEDLKTPPDYKTWFNSAERKGYSGTALYSKTAPKKVKFGIGIPRFDNEGRVIHADYGKFIFLNIYFPNGKMNKERLQYKLDFYEAALKYFDKLVAKGKKLVITGDFNTAHNEIDLARPKENELISGFLRVERDWLDKLVDHGYIDCFRKLHPKKAEYTWWSMRARARERDVGWRIDYFFTSKNFINNVKDCYHLTEEMGSDHCPLVLVIRP